MNFYEQTKAKHQAEIMLAYAEGKAIEIKSSDGSWMDIALPMWNWGDSNYRIKPAEPKKVKLLAWLSPCGMFTLYEEGSENCKFAERHPNEYTRVPSEDKEILL